MTTDTTPAARVRQLRAGPITGVDSATRYGYAGFGFSDDSR